MARDPVYAGKKLSIHCFEFADGECPAGDYLESLDDKDRTKLLPIWVKLGDFGELRNEEMFRRFQSSDGIYEVKRGHIRIYCFFVPGGKLILTHGVTYKGKHRKADIKKAESYKKLYFAALEALNER